MGNDYGETSAADVLAGINNEIQANKAGKTSNSKFTPNFFIPAKDTVEIQDDVDLNGGLVEVADSIGFSDDVSLQYWVFGMFQITDDSGGGAGVTQPGKIEFSDVG